MTIHELDNLDQLQDQELTALLQDAYADDPALEKDISRAGRIMNFIKAASPHAEEGLRDNAMTALLQDTYDGDPALAEDVSRTSRIMSMVMAAGAHAEQGLRDNALTALLEDTYTDDPNLAESHGRSERIMRKVLSSGLRPARPAFRWAPLAWALGSLSTAAAAVFMMLSMMTSTVPIANPPKPKPDVDQHEYAINTPPDNPPEISPAPNMQEMRHDHWHNPPARKPGSNSPAVPAPKTDPVTIAQSPEHNAMMLREAADTMRSMGDLNTAYELSKASYDTIQTPGACLALARNLQELGEQELNQTGI